MGLGDSTIAKRIPVRTGRLLSLLGIPKVKRITTFKFCMFSWMEMSDKAGILPQEFDKLDEQKFMELALWSSEWAARAPDGDKDKHDLKDARDWIGAMTQGNLNEVAEFMLQSRIGGARIKDLHDVIEAEKERKKDIKPGPGEVEPAEKK